jgi:hypothetical protein
MFQQGSNFMSSFEDLIAVYDVLHLSEYWTYNRPKVKDTSDENEESAAVTKTNDFSLIFGGPF